MKDGGCITKQWSRTLEVGEPVIDLLSREPHLMSKLERLHDKHSRRLPRVMAWGDDLSTHLHLDEHRTATILTSCVRGRGLRSACWYVSSRRGRR